MEKKEISQYVPLDKSWMIRVGVLDIINWRGNIEKFLVKQKNLNDDLQALYHAARDWGSGNPIDVGESGTLYRFLKFACWKQKLDKEFILRGTLKEREICNNKEIISWPLEKLLQLDNGTSQWASASVLLGNKERIENPPFKLQLTYEAVEHWNERRNIKLCWLPRYDETIEKQALAYLELLETGKTNFRPRHSEDYCFARAFDLITAEEGRKKWPSLEGHETNRIEEMERVIDVANNGEIMGSKDHRVVQAIAMRQNIKKIPFDIKDKNVVNKTWPQFWDFLEYSKKIKQFSKEKEIEYH
ncbi:hypothetical protein HZA33_05550 [Candidatus Pacearchaeota archaeon]|nr:hypothetical protein [Candidatus Pacearchaeota archaeon]